jgi:zona occludens toxin (predicted ATPase)
MNKDLKNILSNSNKDIDNQELLSYLSNQLSKTQSHSIEQQMADDEFMNDAIEGLQQISDQKNIPVHLEELYAGLQKQVAKKNDKKKRRWKDNPQIYLIIIIVILMIMIGFIVIKKINEARNNQPKTTSQQTTFLLKK